MNTWVKLPNELNGENSRFIPDAKEWCSENLGPYTGQSDFRWCYIGLGTFSFNQKEDAVLFTLSWV